MHNRLDWQKQLVRAAMCAITVLALAQEALPAEEGPVLSGTALWALAAGAAWALYGALLRLRRPFAPARLGVLAALLAGVVVLGQSFAAVGTAEMATSRLSWTALVLVGYALLIFSAMRLLLEALSASGEKGDGRFPLPGPAPVWLGALLLACWLPWFVCLFPGTVSNDSISQLKELMGLTPMTNANPVFQTWLLGAFRQVGLWLGGPDTGVALYCVTQAVLMASLMGALLDGIRLSAAPRWLFWAALVFYALCPIFPVFAFCVGKDTNFAMAVLFLSLMVKGVVDEPGRCGAARAAGLCAAAVLCVLRCVLPAGRAVVTLQPGAGAAVAVFRAVSVSGMPADTLPLLRRAAALAGGLCLATGFPVHGHSADAAHPPHFAAALRLPLAIHAPLREPPIAEDLLYDRYSPVQVLLDGFTV